MTRLVRWLMWNRKHFYIAVATVVVFVVVFSLPSPQRESEATPPSEKETYAELVPTDLPDIPEFTPPVVPNPTPLPSDDGLPDQAAMDVAMGLVGAWLDVTDPDYPDVGAYATPALQSGLAMVDPRNIPPGQVEGAVATVVGESYHEVEVDIGEETVTVVLIMTESGWRASDLLP